jgi:hypothetical protein
LKNFGLAALQLTIKDSMFPAFSNADVTKSYFSPQWF